VLRGLISAFRREVRSWYSGDDLDLLRVATMASAAGYGLIRYTAGHDALCPARPPRTRSTRVRTDKRARSASRSAVD